MPSKYNGKEVTIMQEFIKEYLEQADGLNIIRSYSRRKGYVSFEALLTILVEIRRRGGSFICIFDANTWYELGKKGKSGSDASYAKLRERFPDEFVEVPGRNRADEYILLQAEKNGRLIISNDRFKDYRTEYLWLNSEEQCLFKGTIIRGDIEMPDLKISLPVRKDIARMTEELISQREQA
jgi:hypothetical protein